MKYIMRRLFDEQMNYTLEGKQIDNEIYLAIREIVGKHKEVDARDLELVVHNAVYSSCRTFVILDRR